MNRGVLYGPGVPTSGRVVTVVPDGTSLSLTAEGEQRSVPYQQLAAQRGGWNTDALLLEWRDPLGDWSLHLDGASLAAIRAAAPEAWRNRIGRLADAPRAPAALPMLAVVGVLLAILLGIVVLLYRWSDPLVDLAVARIPIAWEERLGELTAEVLTRAAPAWPEGPVRDAVTTIGTRLAAEASSPYTFRFVLLDDPQVNAVAAPGGWVVVYAGLVRKAASAEELAGVLAHEVEHVVQRHSLRSLVRQLGWSAVLGVLLWGVGDLGSPLATWASELETLRFSRHQESEADAGALRLLERAGIDPRGLPSFFEKLAAAGPQTPAFWSTHPASDERARRARAAIGDRPTAAPLPFDWSVIQRELTASAGS